MLEPLIFRHKGKPSQNSRKGSLAKWIIYVGQLRRPKALLYNSGGEHDLCLRLGFEFKVQFANFLDGKQ